MTYTLAIGDRTYSSWSLRGWLLFEAFDIPVTVETARLYTPDFGAMLESYAPARTVPALRIDTEQGPSVVWDSLAIAETLAERHPDRGIWPSDEAARWTARAMAAEMHAGFGALRGDCPMNLEHQWQGFAPSDAVRADLARIEALWDRAPGGDETGWLFGAYSAVDVFFAPVAARIAGYGLAVGPKAAAYVARHLADPAFRRWRAMGRARRRPPARL